MQKSARGFTLIELLITITIATTLATFGFSAYSKAQRKQLIITATTNITSLLDSTRKLSLVGTRPLTCTGAFLGYQLASTISENTLSITPLCTTTSGDTVVHTIDNITFASSESVIYRPLVGGVDLAGSTTLNLEYLDDNAATHRIVISESGNYHYEGIVE